MEYDKEHKDSLSKYLKLKERTQSLLQNGKKITPKQWKAEINVNLRCLPQWAFFRIMAVKGGYP